MELYYVICVCISEKNNGHCKRIIGENNGQKIGALKNRIIGNFLSIIYQGLSRGPEVAMGSCNTSHWLGGGVASEIARGLHCQTMTSLPRITRHSLLFVL